MADNSTMVWYYCTYPTHLCLVDLWRGTVKNTFCNPLTLSYPLKSLSLNTPYRLFQTACWIFDTSATAESDITHPPTPRYFGRKNKKQKALFKEVLRRENQGLKVYPVDGSSVFSMTGTYFWFVFSMLSGLILKKTPEACTLFCCHSSCAA